MTDKDISKNVLAIVNGWRRPVPALELFNAIDAKIKEQKATRNTKRAQSLAEHFQQRGASEQLMERASTVARLARIRRIKNERLFRGYRKECLEFAALNPR